MIPDGLAKSIATLLKVDYLKRQPGMDRVAVALNARPTDDEIERVHRILVLISGIGSTYAPRLCSAR